MLIPVSGGDVVTSDLTRAVRLPTTDTSCAMEGRLDGGFPVPLVIPQRVRSALLRIGTPPGATLTSSSPLSTSVLFCADG